MVTLSRKRRWTRVLTVRRNHVPAVDTASATAATSTRVASCAATPSAISLNQSARSASGSAERSASANDQPMSAGSYLYPSLQSRHIEETAGGNSREDVMRHALLFLGLAKTLGLEIEHRAVPAPLCHELVVRPELDDASMLEHADAIGQAHGREAVRNEN